MDNWIIMYRVEDGTEDEYICAAVNRFMAWDLFTEFCEEAKLEVISADCCKL